MGKHIKNFLFGFGQALVISPDREYTRPSRSDLKSDATRLRGDTKAVGSDLRKKLKNLSNGESSYNS